MPLQHLPGVLRQWLIKTHTHTPMWPSNLPMIYPNETAAVAEKLRSVKCYSHDSFHQTFFFICQLGPRLINLRWGRRGARWARPMLPSRHTEGIAGITNTVMFTSCKGWHHEEDPDDSEAGWLARASKDGQLKNITLPSLKFHNYIKGRSSFNIERLRASLMLPRLFLLFWGFFIYFF